MEIEVGIGGAFDALRCPSSPTLPLCFSGSLTKHGLTLSWSPLPLLSDGDGTVRSQLCRAVCLYPPIQGLCVHYRTQGGPPKGAGSPLFLETLHTGSVEGSMC